MAYKVAIRNNTTREVRMYPIDLEWEEHSGYWWTEGSMGCDCNLFLAFERAGGVEPDQDIVDIPCGDTGYNFLYAILPNGKIIKPP